MAESSIRTANKANFKAYIQNLQANAPHSDKVLNAYSQRKRNTLWTTYKRYAASENHLFHKVNDFDFFKSLKESAWKQPRENGIVGFEQMNEPTLTLLDKKEHITVTDRSILLFSSLFNSLLIMKV